MNEPRRPDVAVGPTLTLVPDGADEIHSVHVPPVPVLRKSRRHLGQVGADGRRADTPEEAGTRSQGNNRRLRLLEEVRAKGSAQDVESSCFIKHNNDNNSTYFIISPLIDFIFLLPCIPSPVFESQVSTLVFSYPLIPQV